MIPTSTGARAAFCARALGPRSCLRACCPASARQQPTRTLTAAAAASEAGSSSCSSAMAAAAAAPPPVAAEEARARTADMLDFINTAWTPWHAVEEASRRLLAAGFTHISEKDAWNLQPGARTCCCCRWFLLVGCCCCCWCSWLQLQQRPV